MIKLATDAHVSLAQGFNTTEIIDYFLWNEILNCFSKMSCHTGTYDNPVPRDRLNWYYVLLYLNMFNRILHAGWARLQLGDHKVGIL